MLRRASGLALLLLLACSKDSTQPESNIVGDSATSDAEASSSTTSTSPATTSGLSGTGYVDDVSTGLVGDETTGFATDDGSGTDTGVPEVPDFEACVDIDVDGCFADVLETCDYPVTQECIDLIESCYGTVRPPAVSTDALHGLCEAELEGYCLDAASPGCGETYCACIAGEYPFDWGNCFHLTLAGCRPSSSEAECDATLALCYPSGTQQQWDDCYDDILEEAPNCNCPMCGGADQCEVLLDACMG